MQKSFQHPKLARNRVVKFNDDALGRAVSQTGSKAGIDINALSYRFSTKPMELELATANTTLVPPPISSGLYYYGYRFYSPNLGRWISRDPIREEGGMNMYQFVWNDATELIDVLGLADINVTITRTLRNSYETVGNFTATANNEEAAQCCGSVSGSTLELPEGRYALNPWQGRNNGVKKYPIPRGSRAGEYSRSETTGLKALSSSYNAGRMRYFELPLRPYLFERTASYNINIFNPNDIFTGARMHAGTSCLSSRGCPIIGPSNPQLSNIQVRGNEPGSRPDQRDTILYLYIRTTTENLC